MILLLFVFGGLYAELDSFVARNYNSETAVCCAIKSIFETQLKCQFLTDILQLRGANILEGTGF